MLGILAILFIYCFLLICLTSISKRPLSTNIKGPFSCIGHMVLDSIFNDQSTLGWWCGQYHTSPFTSPGRFLGTCFRPGQLHSFSSMLPSCEMFTRDKVLSPGL